MTSFWFFPEVKDKRDAWLALFSSDEPEMVIRLLDTYPEFHEIYEEGYEICRNVERVIEMFSKELYELDRNTVQYMIDEMQDTIDAQKDELDKQKNELNKQKGELDKQKGALDERDRTIRALQEEHEKSLSGAVSILRSLNISEQEIITRVCEQYQTSDEQVRKYLQK